MSAPSPTPSLATPAAARPPEGWGARLTGRLKARIKKRRLAEKHGPALPSWRHYTRLPPLRLWELLWQPGAGRMNHALCTTAGCLASILVGEIWQVPMTQLLPVMLLALWAEDWMTNCILGTIMIVYFTLVMGVVYVGMRFSINNYFLILFINLVFSYFFFFCTTASKLGILSMLGGLFMTLFLSDFDTLPSSDLATRALLYCWLIFALIGVIQICVSLAVSPSPERVLSGRLSWRLDQAARLLRDPADERAHREVRDLLRQGVTPLLANLFLSAKEKIFPAPTLDRLRQAALHSFAVLVIVDKAARAEENLSPADRAAYAALLDDMAAAFRKNRLPALSVLPPTRAPLLRWLGETLRVFCAFSSEPLPKPAQPKGFFLPGAFTAPEHTLFSLKGTLTILLGIMCYRGLDWSGIHTCVVTSFVAAQPTMGEVIAKLNLRIAGAVIGSLMGMGAIIWLLPHFINIAELLLMFMGLTIVASWIQCGDPRISYAGMQIGIAIFLSTLATFTPATNLDVPRDRIIGTFLGLLISYGVFTCLWPASAREKLPDLERKVQAALSALAAARTPLLRVFRAAMVQEAIAEAQRMLEYNTLEPAPYRPTPQELTAHRHRLERATLLMETLLTPSVSTEAPAL